MSQNRLNLDFSRVSREDRLNFITNYLKDIKFTPNEYELDMIAKYILWGKPSGAQKDDEIELELETRHKTWASKKTESLDALIESPNFSESSIRSSRNPATKLPHQKFSRKEARASSPEHLRPVFETLWRQIDQTDLLLNFYELKVGKRKIPPREKLLERFSQEEIDAISKQSDSLKPYTALKLKHELAELRTTQYTLKDSYAPQILGQNTYSFHEEFFYTFGEEVQVRPTWIPRAKELDLKVFRTDRFPIPEDFTEEDLKAISTLLWTQTTTPTPTFVFDFGCEEHLHALFKGFGDLSRALEEASTESNLKGFARLLGVYVKLAPLSEMERDLLRLKIKGV